jgi:3-hydroxybutyryl-CoA dehydrogenase
MFDAGRFGRKTGAGFHDYGSAPAAPDPVGSLPERKLVAWMPEPSDALDPIGSLTLADADDGVSPILVLPEGEDATTIACRLGIDPSRTVALDLTCASRKLVTVMKPPTPERTALEAVSAWLGGQQYAVVEIKDSAGFVAPRILAMVANLGCEIAQIGLASPADIDLAMKLGLNYPQGSLELAALLGPARVHRILQQLAAISGSDRYRPSLWLRRRAMLGLDIHQPD